MCRENRKAIVLSLGKREFESRQCRSHARLGIQQGKREGGREGGAACSLSPVNQSHPSQSMGVCDLMHVEMGG